MSNISVSHILFEEFEENNFPGNSLNLLKIHHLQSFQGIPHKTYEKYKEKCLKLKRKNSDI